MTSPFSLTGKTILITGASSGIGRAAAIEVSRAGADCCVLVARNEKALKETASMLSESCRSLILSCDLSDADSIQSLVNDIPVLDGVVFNAGINKMKPLPFWAETDLHDIFGVNCFAPALLLKSLVRKKKLANPSSVVFTASISGHSNVSVGNGIYGASKAALTAFMKYSALELASKGIRCNAVHPGRVETPLIHKFTSEEDIRKDLTRYPLGRYALPEEVAWTFVYLLSDAAAYITGSDIVIDGGRSLT
ncbi:MAG: SDR family oxidoreductase [Muribaculaceae bacterium]|nr:SDR family oxidoreductase [Muribaculaceae bacterium]